MATDYQALIIPIGLDVSQFDKSIKDVMAGFKEISKTIKDTPANLLTEETKKTYQELKRTVDLLQSKAFDAPLDNLETSAKKGRTALTNLNLVVQDLPFGFIGIQNNLPGLISSFGRLSEETKDSGGAFKALVEQLKGPGGTFLAFTVVTSAVTFLTKEYGSLDNAMKALLSGAVDPLVARTEALDKAFKEYTKELRSNQEITSVAAVNNAGLIETVYQLSKSATDLSSSEQERGKYLDKLKEIDKTYFGQLTTGKSDIDAINEATKKYTESLIAQSTVKAYQSQLDAIEAQIAPLKVLRDELKSNLELAKIQDKLNAKIIAQSAALGGGAAATGLGDPIKEANKALDENAVKLEELYKNRDRFISGLGQSIEEWKKYKTSVDKTTGSVEKFKFSLPKTGEFLLNQGFFAPENQLKRLEDYANVILDVNAKEKARAEALQGFSADAAEYLGYIDVTKLSYKELQDAIVSYGFYLQDLILYEKKLAELRKNRQPATEVADEYIKAFKNRFKDGENPFEVFLKQFNDEFAGKLSKDLLSSYDRFFKEVLSPAFQKRAIQNVQIKSDLVPVDFDAINKGLKMIDDETSRIKDSLLGAMSGLQDIIEKTFFDLLDTGAANWKVFADAVIKEVKRIIAALAVKTLVETLANLFAPGSGAAVKGLLKDVPTDELGAYLDQFPDPSANFGGIRGAGYEMNGAVNLTIRGNDLVGAINRTNTSIRRIG